MYKVYFILIINLPVTESLQSIIITTGTARLDLHIFFQNILYAYSKRPLSIKSPTESKVNGKTTCVALCLLHALYCITLKSQQLQVINNCQFLLTLKKQHQELLFFNNSTFQLACPEFLFLWPGLDRLRIHPAGFQTNTFNSLGKSCMTCHKNSCLCLPNQPGIS